MRANTLFFYLWRIKMEKYAVDYENDDVELKAQELTKTGMDLTEARLAAQKEREANNGRTKMEQFQSGVNPRSTS